MPKQSVISNEYIDKTQSEVERVLGKPDEIRNDYVSIGLKPKPEDKDLVSTWYYKTSDGHLYIWFSRDKCFESLYFDDHIIF